ncbi:hypothetical protein ILYODFUR_030073 [Ilyodon furcidens]|uniref:Uncharacterized protein n=1 Tax=Ilyodon furcidens TaxID=33524 RepID=A0ABV0U9P8_9TELE
MATKPAAGAVDAVTSELQNFSPFTALEDGTEQPCPVAEGVGGATADRSFRPHHMCSMAGAPATSDVPRAGTNGGALDYAPYYVPAAQYYSGLAKEHSVESQDSSTLSSPPSDGLAPPQAPPGATAPDSLFQFSIGKILEDEGATVAPKVQGTDCELPGFYSEGSGVNRGATLPQLCPPDKADPEGPPTEQRQIHRSVHLQQTLWNPSRIKLQLVNPTVLYVGLSCPLTTSGTTVTTLRFWLGPGQ